MPPKSTQNIQWEGPDLSISREMWAHPLLNRKQFDGAIFHTHKAYPSSWTRGKLKFICRKLTRGRSPILACAGHTLLVIRTSEVEKKLISFCRRRRERDSELPSPEYSEFPVMPYLVRENLFIGNIGDAAEVLQNGSSDITHILSVLSSASISFFSEWRSGLTFPTKEIKKVYVGGSEGGSASEDDSAHGSNTSLSTGKLLYLLEYAGKDLKLVRMAVPLRDMESEDLLDYLDVCLDFIDKSRKQGSVLVHCFAGVSRSAAIITAYLMRTEHLSQEDAIESLRQSCEFVCPNDGFLDQLKMFEKMNFKVDHASPIYKRFRLKVLGESYNRGEKIDSSKFGADPGMPTEVSSEVEAPPNAGSNCTPVYRCKKCRRIVAMQENVVDHIPGEGETSFEWRKRKSSNPFNKSDESECSSIFVEPLRWMTAVEEGALEGKLSCVHCEARLGYFNWSGIQCSCGSWITPAFQLHKGRVDMSTI